MMYKKALCSLLLTASTLALCPALVYADSDYYRAAVAANGFLYVSGQNAQEGNELLKEDIKQQTKKTLALLSKTLKKQGYDFDDVINVTVALARQEDFTEFNKVYIQSFSTKPARSTTLGVLHQNQGALVEISLVAYKKPKTSST